MGLARFFLLLRNAAASPRSRSMTPLPCYDSHAKNNIALFHPHRHALFSTSAQTHTEDPSDSKLGFVVKQIENLQTHKIEQAALKDDDSSQGAGQGLEDKEESVWSSSSKVKIEHPWPEWIELMERLVENDYFENRGSSDEDEESKERFNMFKDLNTVRNACLNFGRDRWDILRSLSRKDIQVVVGYGCPSLDRKVVNSGKRLRAYVNLEEGDVCSTCNLRGSCDRAYINPREEEGARTVDMMRILLTYGFDPLIGSADKLHTKKIVKESVCKLLKEVVDLSATPLDPNIPKPMLNQPPPRMKPPPPPPRKRVGRTDVEMKAGDWLCPQCNLINFAKNMVCLQCDERRPRRQLNPGEWECPACNYLNFRRNMVCLKCDCKRPKDDYAENLRSHRTDNWADDMSGSQQSKYTERKWKNPVNMANSLKAWNDDLDDDESDVDDDEFADLSKTGDDSFNRPRRRKGGGIDDDIFKFDDFPVRGGKRGISVGGKKEQDEVMGWNKSFGRRDLGVDKRMPSSRTKANGFDDLDLDEDDDDDDDEYSANVAPGRRVSDGYGRPSTSSRGKGKAYNINVTDDEDEDGWFGSHQGKGSGPSKRSLSSRPKEVKRSYERFGDLDEDDDDDLFESEDEQPQPSRTKWSREEARSTRRAADRTQSRNQRGTSSSSRERRTVENDHDSDDLDDIYKDVEDPFDFKDTNKGGKYGRSNERKVEGNRVRNGVGRGR
eukprot:Gb_22941 [translate_table: standard]